jgi:3-oxoacyl-[acyl-carrier-protein] synthase-3
VTIMNSQAEQVAARLLDRVRLVQEILGQPTEPPPTPEARFSDLLDSMGMVEFLALVAEDFGVRVEVIEDSVAGRFGTVAELAGALEAAGLSYNREAGRATAPVVLAGGGPRLQSQPSPGSRFSGTASVWLAATAERLPDQVEPASQINAALGRPDGWLESHAGIMQRRVWAGQDPLDAAAEAGRDCLRKASVAVEDVGAMLVTSEAPPMLAGLAAALHHRLGIPQATPALEVGGACTGTLAAFWMGQALLSRADVVLVISVEAATRYLFLQAGPAGEVAALFGDGAAASLLCNRPTGPGALPLTEVVLGCDGDKRHLIDVRRSESGEIELHLDGGPLASQAVQTMAQAVQNLLRKYGLQVGDLQAVVAHGGNGRLPALLARKLDLPEERVWSETPRTGNLGSASLPVAWSARSLRLTGPVIWTAVGAGLTWGAALLGVEKPGGMN